MGNTLPMSSPSPWVSRFAPLVEPGGGVLDVAAGGGRHTRLFLERGHAVTAVDRSLDPRALAGAQTVVADLEDGSPWPLGGRQFAGIVVTNYLWRPLFSVLLTALAPGGVLIYETFAHGNAAYGSPRNPDFLLNRGELLDHCRSLTVVAFEDGDTGQAVVQRICAVNGPGPFRISP
ncbi:MAG: class I SAM-dependent methyltransferase [Magnetospirillum gryphiswaldense]|nr:class I SAM-dependent methyltransferase [Magnetospirillum gryphiswaldense]